MSKGKLKVRGNGDVVRPYADNSKDEVAEALAEMEDDARAVDLEIAAMLADGPADYDEPQDGCEEWPNDELEQA